MKYTIRLIAFASILVSCQSTSNSNASDSTASIAPAENLVNKNGKNIQKRFNPPSGFKRKSVLAPSFAQYLRNLPLKPVGSKVMYYNGAIKENPVYDAVVDIEIGKQNLQQCADAVMRLRGEYFYSRKDFDSISFALTNGFEVSFRRWTKGDRVVVNGNETNWHKSAEPSHSYQAFRQYMDFIFSYAGTLSLSQSLKTKAIQDISIGDVFIVGGSPGHAVIVVDVAENPSGEKVFMLAQSYMPAQETQILKNIKEPGISPWYRLPEAEVLITPEWRFNSDELKSW